jgi:hypothetical protein
MSPELSSLCDQITVLQIEISDAHRQPEPSPRLPWQVHLLLILILALLLLLSFFL